MRTLSLLAALALTTPFATGQILSDQAWVQGNAGGNFGVGHTDLNLDTGELAVWIDYQGLEGDLIAVEVLDEGGSLVMSLAFDGAREGFARGATMLDRAAALALSQQNYSLRFLTVAHPTGEMEGFFAFPDATIEARPLDGDQVVGGGALGATASMHLTRYRDGRVILSGGASGVDLPFTSIELRGPAWFGEDGPLVMDLAPFNNSNVAQSFFIDVPAGTLTDEQLQDIDDGFAYVLLRTAQYPNGALRGQTVLPQYLGENYCAGRSNSGSQIGGRLTLTGSPRVAASDLVLQAQFVPNGVPLLPIVGSGTGHSFLPGGSQGNLCLGGAPIVRLVGNLSTGGGLAMVDMPIDLGTLPSNAGLVVGEWLQFQCWFRDSDNGAATSNFSDAVRIRPR